MNENKGNSSWMDAIPPKTLFIGGIVGGILVLCTIGFFILLGVVLSDGSSSGGEYYPTTPSADNTGTNPTPSVGTPAAVTSDDHVAGSKDAKVTLIEYSDYQCPFCSRFHPTLERVVSEYKGKVRWVYRNFPLDSIHPEAANAANAAECIASLKGNDAYWKYGSLLFSNQDTLGADLYSRLALQVGANKASFESCYSSGKFAAKVKAQQAEGNSIGVQGTPATFVVAADGSVEMIGGAESYENVKAYVERALAK